MLEAVLRHRNQQGQLRIFRAHREHRVKLCDGMLVVARLEISEPEVQPQSRHARVEGHCLLVVLDCVRVVLLFRFDKPHMGERFGIGRILLRQLAPCRLSFGEPAFALQ